MTTYFLSLPLADRQALVTHAASRTLCAKLDKSAARNLSFNTAHRLQCLYGASVRPMRNGVMPLPGKEFRAIR